MKKRIREWYVIEKAALILYGLGVIGVIVFALQGEWGRVAITVALVMSLWVAALVKSLRSAARWDREREEYERQIADRTPVRQLPRHRRREMQRRRNHR